VLAFQCIGSFALIPCDWQCHSVLFWFLLVSHVLAFRPQCVTRLNCTYSFYLETKSRHGLYPRRRSVADLYPRVLVDAVIRTPRRGYGFSRMKAPFVSCDLRFDSVIATDSSAVDHHHLFVICYNIHEQGTKVLEFFANSAFLRLTVLSRHFAASSPGSKPRPGLGSGPRGLRARLELGTSPSPSKPGPSRGFQA
jgi:hypothetical protein